MNTQHLKYAIEVGKTGSITQAAENLYIGQPSLSKALKELEESMGIIIFKRTSKGAVPTAQGERFLEYAREVLRQVEKMENLARAEHLTAQQLRVSVPRVHYVNSALCRLLAGLDHGMDMNLQINRTSAVNAIQHVAEDGSELAVIRYPVRYERYFLDYIAEKKLSVDQIWEGEPVLLMHRTHPLALAKEIRDEDIAAWPVICYADETVPYLAKEDMEEYAHGRRIAVSDEDMLLQALQAIPSACTWEGDASPEMLARMDLVARPVGCFGHIRDALVYPQGYVFRPQDRKLIDEITFARNKMMYGGSEMLENELHI